MAQQVEVLLIDEVMAVWGDGTVRVGLDGTGYEIGRTAGRARALRDSPARCVAAAGRQAGGGRRPGWERRASVSGLNHFGRGVGLGAGIEVKDCARVSAELVASSRRPPPDGLGSYGHQSHGAFTHMPMSERRGTRSASI